MKILCPRPVKSGGTRECEDSSLSDFRHRRPGGKSMPPLIQAVDLGKSAVRQRARSGTARDSARSIFSSSGDARHQKGTPRQ
ncbi:hypothetical protein EVAR_20222_1 [Eumeta japonica]|uniref:Uncharacterized protein n=1 Tax=Eumeta variegata TaxID=151549 RepID=A0A4C1W9L7_EUMVA|nr:hypothetical protein EVAR_20222_1 [Eumeta japonica]